MLSALDKSTSSQYDLYDAGYQTRNQSPSTGTKGTTGFFQRATWIEWSAEGRREGAMQRRGENSDLAVFLSPFPMTPRALLSPKTCK